MEDQISKVETMHNMIKELSSERKILFETLGNLNHQVNNMDMLEDRVHETKQYVTNLEDALYTILSTVKPGDFSNTHKSNELFSKTVSVIINGLLDNPIESYCSNEIAEGKSLSEEIIQKVKEGDTNHIMFSFADDGSFI